MPKAAVLLLVVFLCVVSSLPVEITDVDNDSAADRQGRSLHSVSKRFINPLFSLGSAGAQDISRIRTKRSYDECEKLQLCKLHARSSRNFFSAFELYFVNKENARLWDHHARSMADCDLRYGDCYEK